MRCALIAAFLLIAQSLLSAQPQPYFVIQPLGTVDSTAILSAREVIRNTYNFPVKVDSALPLPQSAFLAPRKRYSADRLLSYLDSLSDRRAFRVIGLTMADISTAKGMVYDYGIMGLAGLDGFSCVVSTFRLRKHHASDSLVHARIGKVVVHELGHTLGLPHCRSKNCLMGDAKGTVVTVDSEKGFCAECRKTLGKQLK